MVQGDLSKILRIRLLPHCATAVRYTIFAERLGLLDMTHMDCKRRHTAEELELWGIRIEKHTHTRKYNVIY